ncbi:Vacuolar protein-sorting-associated protein 27, partial [Blyttiomyces sp. JEL0837]
MSFLFTNPFDDIVEKATSENQPIGYEDIVLNLEIADKVKAKEVPPKQAVQSLKRRINHKNPNVQLSALKLTDTCVKNGGKHFLVEVASRDFMDNLVSLGRSYSSDQAVRQKCLALIQTWGISFRGKSELSYVCEIYDIMKREGITFPPVDKSETASALIDTKTAPEWSDSDVCMRCRTSFTTFNRKHHCRNCGQTFCHSCSSKNIALPHLGINQEVRVCDPCHFKVTTKSTPSSPKTERTSSRSDAIQSPSSTNEDDELQRAIAASLAESQPKKRVTVSKPAPKREPTPVVDDEEEDEDLKAAIEASLKELKISEERNTSKKNAGHTGASGEPVVEANPNELSRIELDNLKLFADLVERMEGDVQARGIGVMQHSQISALYAQLYALQPKLLWSLDDSTTKYRTSMELNDKVTNAIQLYDQMLQQRLRSASGGSYPRSYSTDFAQNQSYYVPPPVAPGAQSYGIQPQPPAPQPQQVTNPQWGGYQPPPPGVAPVAASGTPGPVPDHGPYHGYAPPPTAGPGSAPTNQEQIPYSNPAYNS